MTMSDPIADMLTRIRNANTAKHDTVDVPADYYHQRGADPAVLLHDWLVPDPREQ